MRDKLELLRDDFNEKISNVDLFLKKIETSPEEILKNKYVYDDVRSLANFSRGGLPVHEFQKHIYSILTAYLKNTLTECIIDFNKNFFPAPISIDYKGYSMIYLDVYNQTITKRNFNNIKSDEEFLDFLKDEKTKNETYLSNIKKIEKNNLKGIKDLKDLKVYFFNHKDIKESLNKRREEFIEKIEEINNKINKLEEKIKKDKSMKEEMKNKKQEIIDFFVSFGFSVN